MHNQISEGATEYIARKVMETIGEKVEHPDRYAKQVEIIGDIFEARGLPESLTTYFTEPHKLIKGLEKQTVKNKDMLHYISDYINSSHISKLFNHCKINRDGNVRMGIISKISNKIRNRLNKKNMEVLPEANNKSVNNENKKNEFIDNLKIDANYVKQNKEKNKAIEPIINNSQELDR